MDDMQLSRGAIRLLNEPDLVDNNPLGHEPVIQVLSVKKVSSAQGQDRYRLIISDGEFFMQAMLATQLNDLVTSDPPSIEKHSVLKLLTYACNVVQTRRIVICLTVEVLGNPVEKIGNPSSLDAAQAAAAPAAAAGGGDVVMRDAPPAKAPPAKKASTKNGGSPPIYPIEGLSPYQNKWTIKARVTSKSEIRHWTNARGEGKLFSVNLIDDTGEIKATGFNDAVDRLYPQLIEGKVYYISKARVNIAKKQFSNLTSEYEIAFENGTEVTECEDQESAPQIKFNFIELAALANVEKDSTCDVLGIVKDNGTLGEITTKATQKQLKKRELTVCDKSGYEVRVTLWGKSAEDWVDCDNDVYAFKGAKVGDFGGRTLSMGGQSTIHANPDIPQAHELKGWFDTDGSSTAFQAYSSGAGSTGTTVFKAEEFKSLAEIKDENIGMDDVQQFSMRGTITFVKPEGMSYPACPAEKCNKKVTLEGEGAWRCEKCDKTYPAPEYRYILTFVVSDHTSQIWVSSFNEIGMQVMGKTADEMHELKEDDDAEFEKAIKQAVGTVWNFGCRAKNESYQEVTRVRYSATKAAKVDWAESTRQILKQIQAY